MIRKVQVHCKFGAIDSESPPRELESKSNSVAETTPTIQSVLRDQQTNTGRFYCAPEVDQLSFSMGAVLNIWH